MKLNQKVSYKGIQGTVVGQQPSLFEGGQVGYLIAFPWPKPASNKASDLMIHENTVKYFKTILRVETESPVVHRILDERDLQTDGTENS